MGDYVTSANNALQLIGAEQSIVSPTQDSHVSRVIKGAWEGARRSAIRGTSKLRPKWNFAMRYWELPARVATTVWPIPYGWVSAFPLPGECLRLIEIVYPEAAIDDYQLVGGESAMEVLARVTGPLKLWGLRDVEEVALWDASFAATFEASLAFQVADSLTGDRGRKQDAWAAFQDRLRGATGADAGENPPIEPEESGWVAARYGGCRPR